MILETERLRLRPMCDDDYEPLCALYADPEVMRYVAGVRTREQTRERLDVMIDHWARHGFGICALFHRPDDAFVGRCGVCYARAGEAELAYTLARPFWGRGLATEAARAASATAFERFRLPQIVAYADVQNTASQRVMIKLGMRPDGTAHVHGCDAVRYVLDNPAVAVARPIIVTPA
jgi:ribosomal-protein-alanine N-acetyltransferase